MGHWKPDLWDREAEENEPEEHHLKCKRCGSEDVRWRQQGGRWMLFSLTPGVEHRCPNPAENAFEDLTK